MNRSAAAAVLVLGCVALPLAQPKESEPAIDDVLRRLGEYVASYGDRASVIVAVEKQTQTLQGVRTYRPRTLVAELALVKTLDEGEWVGFRDVIEVNGQRLTDREGRLERILTDRSATVSQAKQIADESSRFNLGPVVRNFNVPTTALFFLSSSNQPRFAFRRRKIGRIDGVTTWEVAFRETHRPTLVRTRTGVDVPMEGTVWVVPEDGTVVRTRVSLKGFADVITMGEPRAPRLAEAPPPPPTGPPTPPPSPPPTQSTSGGQNTGAPGAGTTPPPAGGSPAAGPSTRTSGRVVSGGDTSGANTFSRGQLDSLGGSESMIPERLESEATIDVRYRFDARFGVWLPSKMTETYGGAISPMSGRPITGRARVQANYSDFRRFETSARLVESQRQ